GTTQLTSVNFPKLKFRAKAASSSPADEPVLAPDR
ncbi:MAG: hypothetical protein ACI87A_003640, partial [Planctomycetota bacterium]